MNTWRLKRIFPTRDSGSSSKYLPWAWTWINEFEPRTASLLLNMWHLGTLKTISPVRCHLSGRSWLKHELTRICIQFSAYFDVWKQNSEILTRRTPLRINFVTLMHCLTVRPCTFLLISESFNLRHLLVIEDHMLRQKVRFLKGSENEWNFCSKNAFS